MAVTAVSEDGTTTRAPSRAPLRDQVAALARWLRETGVRRGQRGRSGRDAGNLRLG